MLRVSIRHDAAGGCFVMWRTALAGAAAVAIALLMVIPAGVAAPASGAASTPRGVHALAGDPTGFPPANYTNPTLSAPPAVPDTTPSLVNLSSYGNVSIPNGTWETVLLNYTGYTAGTAYDYFQSVTIDGAMVYVGVNPEAGRWSQLVNLSAYLAFFDGHSSVNISGPALGQGANFQGVQINNLTLEFYPVPNGAPSPAYANLIEPLFAFAGTPSTRTITIPSNASAVVLEMMAIGSEFWYTLNPDFTAVTVAIGGHNVSTYLQYPWINSGGIDLFSWRPIYPVHMLNHQWESFNLTGALGLIEGTQNLTVSAAAGAVGADVIANLLVYTNPNVTGARSLGYRYHQAPVQTTAPTNDSLVNLNGNNFTYYNQTDSIDYSYSSVVRTTTGFFTAAAWTSERFANHQSLTPVWQNITQLETVRTVQAASYWEHGLRGFTVSEQELAYPLAMQVGEALQYLSSNGSLSYYNYTSYFDNVTQGYFELDQSYSNLNRHESTTYRLVDDQIYGTNGYFASVLEFGPGFAIILNVTSSLHTTRKVDTEVAVVRSGRSTSVSFYQHRIAGLENNSTSYYVQETVTLDQTVSFSFGHGGRDHDHWIPRYG